MAANRSLGVLTIDIIAKTGGFETGMDKAARKADNVSRQMRKNARDIEKAWSSAGKLMAAGFAGITIGSTIAKFVQQSRDAQNEQAQLAAAIRSTGEAAGYSVIELNKMAESMAGKTVFSEGEINRAQTRLLTYTGIVGEEFPQAMQAVIDMSARMGMSVEQSAETVGRALDIPSQGLTALTKQGFRFTEDQKKLVRALEATGEVGKAQKVILDSMNSAYAGAAEAARNTFGGAITGLQNQLNNLMTGSDGSLQGTTDALNELTKTLASSETKAAFATLSQLIANTITLLAKATTHFFNFGTFVGESLGRAVNGPNVAFERVDEKISGIRKELDLIEKRLARPLRLGPGSGNESAGLEKLRERAEKLRNELQGALRDRETLYQMSMPGALGGAASTKEKKEIRDNKEFYDKYIADRQSQAQQLKEALDVESLAFKRATLNLNKDSKEYQAALSAFNIKTAEIRKQFQTKGGGDSTKQSLASQTKELERYISEQQQVFQTRNRFLEIYNQQGLYSIADYYERQQNILDEATQNQIRAYDEQIRALRDYQSKAGKATDRADAQEKINAILAKQSDLQRQAGVSAIEAGFAQIERQEAYARTIAETNAQLLELRGNLVEAAAIRFDLQNEGLIRLFSAEGNKEMLEKVEIIRSMTTAQVGLNKLQKDYSLIQEQLSISEDRIALSQQLGAHGQIDSLVKLGKVRQQSYDQMKLIVSEYEKMAKAANDPAMTVGAERLKLQLEQLGAELDPLADHINGIFKDSFGDAFSDFISGTKSASDAFKSFMDTVNKQLLNLVSKNLSDSLFGSITGGSGGGFNIGSWLSGLFGGGKAGGGPTLPNTLYRVNERGPEMFSVGKDQFLMTGSQGGNVTPNHQLPSGTSVVQNFYNPVLADRRSDSQRQQEAARKLRTASRNS